MLNQLGKWFFGSVKSQKGLSANGARSSRKLAFQTFEERANPSASPLTLGDHLAAAGATHHATQHEAVEVHGRRHGGHGADNLTAMISMARHGVDDPAGHDANDDHGLDPTDHDTNDDHGVDPTDDDVNDDHDVDPAGHKGADDQGQHRRHGVHETTRTTAAARQGADDPIGHNAADDHNQHHGHHAHETKHHA